MKRRDSKQAGFTLIELMIVIAIVGILAAIALPAYQDYTIRARISEALAVAAESKTSIAEFASTRGTLPTTTALAGIVSQGFGNGSFVSRQDWVAANGATFGLLTLTLSQTATALGDATGDTFQLRGDFDQNTRRITWRCGPGGGQVILSKYLPSSCRDAF